jgi:hypothetical protein
LPEETPTDYSAPDRYDPPQAAPKSQQDEDEILLEEPD